MYKLGKRFIVRLALLIMVSAVLAACGSSSSSSGSSYITGPSSMQVSPALSSFTYVVDSYNLTAAATTITYASFGIAGGLSLA